MSNNGTQYREDALYMTESTTVDQVVSFLQTCVENPVIVGENGENIVWNFSTHEVDESILEVEDKNCDRFAIPYQVTGVWGWMFTLLPKPIKSAEILVYRKDADEYYAYTNFYRTTPSSRREQIQYDLSRRYQQLQVGRNR